MDGYHPTYNLKAVIRETGLTPATLRAWERRYGLLKPQRSPGGHRLYSEHDITMLKWLVARQNEGLSISHAVELWRNLEASHQDPLQQFALPQLAASGDVKLDSLRASWVKACLVYDETTAEQVLNQAFAIAAPEAVCAELLQKGIAEFGERWYAGTATVQQEHFASALAMRKLNALFAAAPHPTRTGRLLAACPPGEEHDFSLLMLSYILRLHGWDVIYLGANVPLTRLDGTLQQTTPRLVLSVAQTLHSADALSEMAAYVNAQSITLAYGGGIFNQLPALTGRIAGHFLGTELSAVPQVVEHLLTYPDAPQRPLPLSEAYTRTLAHFKEKESLITSTVAALMRNTYIDPRHLQEANEQFGRYIYAALALGDIQYLDHSLAWLSGLLENNGLLPSLANTYYAAYRQAVQTHLGQHGELILDWLAQFGSSS